MQPPPALGPYQIVSELGRGGMGVVYEVRDPGLPGRRLALKQILKNLCGPEAMRRFAREAELLARIQHPNVVRVYACTLDPVAYLVTELVEGEELSKLSRRNDLPLERSCEIVAQLADAVGALHDAGVIHRDLKPDNAIVRPDGTPVLLDFGLARELDAEGMTRTGEVLGTPAYMSPEQADGSKGIDERTDVYGLGAILFCLLARGAPFQAESVIKLVYKVLSEQPDWRRLQARQVEAPLLSIVQRSMEKDRDLRYPSVQALAADLRRYLAGEEVLARPRRSQRGLFAALFAGSLALVAGGLGLYLTRSTPPATPSPSATRSARPSPSAPRAPRDPLAVSTVEFSEWAPEKRSQLIRPYLASLDPDGREVAVQNLREVPLWRLLVSEKIGTQSTSGNLERGLLFLPEGQIVSWFGGSAELVCADLETGKLSWRLELERTIVNAVALAPDGKSLYAFEAPDRARQVLVSEAGWSARPTQVRPYEIDTQGIDRLREKSVKRALFSPQGTYLVLGLGSRAKNKESGALLVREPLSAPKATQIPEGNAITNDVVWTKDERRLFVGGSAVRTFVTPTFGYDLSSGAPVKIFRAPMSAGDYMTTFALCIAGDDLIQTQKDGFVVRFAGVSTFTLKTPPPPSLLDSGRANVAGARLSHRSEATAALSDARGEWVYTIAGNFLNRRAAMDRERNELCVWKRTGAGTPDEHFELHGGPYNFPWAARRAALSPDGDRLALVTVEGYVRVYDAWLLRQ